MIEIDVRRMADEMVKHAGFQDGVNDYLRHIVDYGPIGDGDVINVTDLYEIYGQQQVLGDD